MKLEDCNVCEERKYANRPVPGVGNRELAEICFLGRNPGRTEDKDGVPFVGRAGKKLDVGLVLAGVLRRLVYITNVVKCMTPSNIVPSRACFFNCRTHWLVPEFMSLPKLKLIVTLGNEALKLFEPLGTVGNLHGTYFKTKLVGEKKMLLFVSYHPSAACRSSLMNQHFMDDMGKLKILLLEEKLIAPTP